LIQPENSQINSGRTGSEQIDLPAAIISLSEDETFALGKRLAPMLGKGDVVALKGPLGAGKTCFAKGIARGLGIEEGLTSPTYAIISEYECSISGEKIPVYHIDAYRLEGNDDFSAIGGEEIVFGNGISVIEWSDRIPALIPSDAYRIDFEIIEDNKRSVKLDKQGR
jgi:tRNA threonylcarbamoyladenosine biosynthesis protein TsaE